jgi:quaternary ammonium compound-resistance protein SugE
MAWFFLSVAVVLEVVWAVSLKATHGFTRLWPSVLNVTAMCINLYFLAQAFKLLPVSTAYAIWTGLGAVGVVIFGILIYHEAAHPMRLFFVFLIIAGVVGLKWMTP